MITSKLPDQVREFCASTLHPHSFDPSKNPYIWFGFLWGIPVPVVTTYLEITLTESTNLSQFAAHIIGCPRYWFFLAHPLFFGALFGILGTIRQEKNMEIQDLVEKLMKLSNLDPLTGLANRRHFMNVFRDEAARSSRQTLTLSFVFIDLDFFKNINDTYGHHMGDTVIRKVSQFIQAHCRPYDTTARWGGEEFVILLPASDEEEASAFAERIRAGIAAGVSDEITFSVTISAGVAQYQLGDSLEILVERADQALYAAKQKGRNRVETWGNLQSPQ